MNWSNVKLIWLREVRDQLRDRRTLFMVAVLPLLLYPLLGMMAVQIAQLSSHHRAKVLVIGLQNPPEFPPLIERGTVDKVASYKFVARYLPGGEADARLFDIEQMTVEQITKSGLSPDLDKDAMADHLRDFMREKGYQIVIDFPPEFWTRLKEFREELLRRRADPSKVADPKPADAKLEQDIVAPKTASVVPSPKLFASSVREEAQQAIYKVSQAIQRWRDEIGAQNLRDIHVPPTTAAPFSLNAQDVAEPTQKNAALWSKILPFVLLIWALTGAFYPAIDLCAGEKERGTLETLLCSPAERSEIVAGKLLAIMLFSMATSILNMVSFGGTGLLVIRQMGSMSESLGGTLPIGGPPLAAVAWLLVGLVPTSALFSALCLALASFARSTKEGQYYLMPLVLITMPLMILPMLPGVEMTFGNALIPLTGLMLLMRMLLEGNVWEALPYFPIVAGVTVFCCRIAMGWAVDQFNRESVLFRESERFNLRLWLLHLWHDRKNTPTFAAAIFCGLMILMVQFFVGLLIVPDPTPNFAETVRLILLSQIVPILLPVFALTIFLCRSPRQTLLLKAPAMLTMPGAGLLSLVVFPLSLVMHLGLQKLYPAGQAAEAMKKYVDTLHQAPNWWIPFLFIAILPAICEELAFRGFILSGLRHGGKKWRAILISSLFFAITHQVLQQSLAAFVLGILIAYLAVQTGSLLPGMIFHATYNSLGWLYNSYGERLDHVVEDHPAGTGIALMICLIVAAALLWGFSRFAYDRTSEERLQEAIDQGNPTPELA